MKKWVTERRFGSESATKWEGKTISLLTLKQLRRLKEISPYRVLVDIFGNDVFAIDADEDVRGGMKYVAYGLLVS